MTAGSPPPDASFEAKCNTYFPLTFRFNLTIFKLPHTFGEAKVYLTEGFLTSMGVCESIDVVLTYFASF
jgi:hypothetical protein